MKIQKKLTWPISGTKALSFSEVAYTAGAAAIVLSVTCLMAARKSIKAKDPLIPPDKFGLRLIGEGLCSFLMSFGDSVMGRHNRKYLPFVATIFTYIFFLNIISLLPGVAAATGGNFPINYVFNFGIAAIVFIYYHFAGIKASGVFGYIKHFFGSPELTKGGLLLIGLIVFTVEVVSNALRPIILSLRLFANITADHLLLGAFTDLTKFIVPLIFYVMGTFVSFIQAFVFTMLTMVYISLAVAHDESGEHGHESTDEHGH